ncbi:hypothetical protein K492DRAFT_181652 [Lichtheimia hyalospora FSU 10163]|nr:hypothetical protein K492DRAFT_181652 [Lichtheimia hyalospora FSU 10163]
MRKTYTTPYYDSSQPAIAWSYPDYTNNTFQQQNYDNNTNYPIHPLDTPQPAINDSSSGDATSMMVHRSTTCDKEDVAIDQLTPFGIYNHRRNAAIGAMTNTRPMDIPPWSTPSPPHLDDSEAQQLIRPATCPDTFPFLSSSNFTIGSIPEPPPPWPVMMQAVQTPIDEKNISTPQGNTPDEDEMLVFKIEDLKV